MKTLLLATFLACAAAPAAAAPKSAAPQKAEPKGGAGQSAKNAADQLDIAQLMQFVDKLFPAGPAPKPERLGLARVTAGGVLPDGSYAAMFEELMSGMVERVLSIRPGDLAGKKATGGKPQTALREQLAKDDPHFEERFRITRRVIGEELKKISALMEPKLREGLALSIARRFDEAQLREINAFLATDSGRAFGSQTMRMWMDPDVMRSMIRTFPDMVTAMPSAMQRLEAETKHLPKPKKKPAEKAEKHGGEDAAEAAEEPAADEVAIELPDA